MIKQRCYRLVGKMESNTYKLEMEENSIQKMQLENAYSYITKNWDLCKNDLINMIIDIQQDEKKEKLSCDEERDRLVSYLT